eukprot:4188697-Amphidinium_carterae.1
MTRASSGALRGSITIGKYFFRCKSALLCPWLETTVKASSTKQATQELKSLKTFSNLQLASPSLIMCALPFLNVCLNKTGSTAGSVSCA